MSDSDPEGHRIEAARDLVDAIATFSDSFDLRVAGVGFGSPYIEADADTGPLVILPLSDTRDPSVRDQFRVETMPGTDFHSALCLAWRLATGIRPPASAACPQANIDSEFKPAPAIDLERAKVVVLITDGGPAPRGTALATGPIAGEECTSDALERIAHTGSAGSVHVRARGVLGCA